MPGRLMSDGKDPDLFEHFTAVAQRLGLYTVHDYAAIVRQLAASWAIASRCVTGRAAQAQEFIHRHVQRVEEQAEKIWEQLAKAPPVRFSWIHDRLA